MIFKSTSFPTLICLILLMATATLRTAAQDLVRIQDNGTATLLVDSDKLLGHLNRFIAQVASVEADFTAVEVVRTEEGHALVATGKGYQTALALEKSQTGRGILRAAGLSCTTSCGATPGVCMPNTSDMTCVPVCHDGTCSRTVSADTNILSY